MVPRSLEGMACANLGEVLCELDESQGGFEAALAGLRLAQLSGETGTEAWAHHSAQLAASELGLFSDALNHAQAACAGFKAYADRQRDWINAAAAARNLQHLARDEEALAAADTLLAEVASCGGWDGAIESPYHLHGALVPLGDYRAQGLLMLAHEGLSAQAERVAGYVPRDAFMRSSGVFRNICESWAAAQAEGTEFPRKPAAT